MTSSVIIVGTGSIGARHLSVLRSAGIRAAALPKRQERARELKEQGVEIHGSIAEAKAAGFTSAIVSSDTRLHVKDTLSALEAGMDVLVEKPLAPSYAEAAVLAEAVVRTEHRVAVGCTLRFSESLGRFREWVPRVGQLHSVCIEAQSYLPNWRPQRDYRLSYSARPEEGGVLRDLIHEIDYAGWIFGWPDQVQGTLGQTGVLGIQAEESADIFWRSPNGAALSMRLDYLTQPARRLAMAMGDNGTLHWDGIAQTVRFQSANGDTEEFHSKQTRDEMLLTQDLAFLESNATGADSKQLASLQQGLRALAVCDAIRLSSESRAETKVNVL